MWQGRGGIHEPWVLSPAQGKQIGKAAMCFLAARHCEFSAAWFLPLDRKIKLESGHLGLQAS